MDIPIHARVSCLDGPFGQSMCVILKPTTQQITHVVVSDDGFPETEYLIAINQIAESTPEQIRLNCSSQELKKMPVFDKMEFVPSNLAGFTGGSFMMWPYISLPATYITLEKEHIPADELIMRRGTRVEAVDGAVGHVNEFLIDPNNDHITHLVLREGHFWGKKDVTIPVSQIDHYQDNTVYLKLNKQDIEKLPAIPVGHNQPVL